MKHQARRAVWRLYCSFALHLLPFSLSRYSVGGSWERWPRPAMVKP